MTPEQQKTLLDGLNCEETIEWLPELKVGRPAFDFLINTLHHSSLTSNQHRNALHALMKLRAIGNGDHQATLNEFVAAATNPDCRTRSEAITLALGLVRYSKRLGIVVSLSDDDISRIRQGISTGVSDEVKHLADDFLSQIQIDFSMPAATDAISLTPEERRRFAWLAEFLTPGRMTRLQEVLAKRTRHITVVLDDIYQVHNISALLRSCETLGIQDAHVIEVRNALEPCPEIAMGAEKWLTVRRYTGETCVADCMRQLKASGYRIVVTSPHAEAATPAALSIERPTAIVMGNETEGVRDEITAQADELLRIDMYGFTESFNLSVSAAICLSRLRERLQSANVDWRLSDAERERLLFEWVRASVPHREALERRFIEQNTQ